GATPATIADGIAAQDPDLERADIDAFVHRLVDAQILDPETTLSVTGADAFSALARTLAPHPSVAAIVDRMRHASRQLRDIDASGPGVASNPYQHLAEPPPPL